MNETTIRRPSRETEDQIVEIWETELGEVGIPVDNAAIWVSSVLLEGITERYGPEGSEPLAYHGPQHTLDVIRRGLRLFGALHCELPVDFPARDAGLQAISGAGHDAFHHTGKDDELKSASATSAVMHAHKNSYSSWDIHRVGGAILATKVGLNEQGYIEQTNIRRGDRDPLKLTLAYADINGIAMEGAERMIRDATALFMESKGYTKPHQMIGDADQLVAFLGGQARFLQSRLQAMPGDVAFYFKDNESAVRAALVMSELFKPRDFALKAAEFMEDTPIIRTMLRGMSIGSLDDLTTFVHDIFAQVTGLIHRDKNSESPAS